VVTPAPPAEWQPGEKAIQVLRQGSLSAGPVLAGDVVVSRQFILDHMRYNITSSSTGECDQGDLLWSEPDPINFLAYLGWSLMPLGVLNGDTKYLGQ